MLGCLFGSSRGRMFLKIAQHGAKSSLYKVLLSSRRNKTSKNRKGALGCGVAMHMSTSVQFCQTSHHNEFAENMVENHTQGSGLSFSQRKICLPKTQARKGPSSNRANLHLELPGASICFGLGHRGLRGHLLRCPWALARAFVPQGPGRFFFFFFLLCFFFFSLSLSGCWPLGPRPGSHDTVGREQNHRCPPQTPPLVVIICM